MVLTAKQEEGLRIALDRYHAGEKFTVISGYAGTGKSTLVRFIIEALNIDEEDVVYTAFTGKAAEVLHKKGNKNAMTLHKLLYDSFPKGDGTFFKKPKALIDYKFIVVDEVFSFLLLTPIVIITCLTILMFFWTKLCGKLQNQKLLELVWIFVR